MQRAEKRDCEDRYTSIDAKIALDKSRPSASGVWVLSVTVKGVDGRKRYKNQKYVIPFNGKTHVAPKSYPPNVKYWGRLIFVGKRLKPRIPYWKRNPCERLIENGKEIGFQAVKVVWKLQPKSWN